MDSKCSAALSDPVLEDESKSHTRPNVRQMAKSFEDQKQKEMMTRSTEVKKKGGNMGPSTDDHKTRQSKTEHEAVDDHSREFSGDEYHNKKEVRMVLIGKTGSGKSATANTILGKKQFKSKTSGISITQMCQTGTVQLDGRSIHLVDTPGLFDTGMTHDMTMKEVVKCISLVAPGPHAIILVVRIGRFTEEEDATVKYFRDKFGEDMMKYLIVLFTGKDELDESFAQLLKEVPKHLKHILRDCEDRAIAFNNKSASTQQRLELLKMIDCMVHCNGECYYTNGMFRESELAIGKREEEIRLEEYQRFIKEKEKLEIVYQKSFDRILNEIELIKAKLNSQTERETVAGNTMAHPDADARSEQTQDEISSLREELESSVKELHSAHEDLRMKLNEQLESYEKKNTTVFRRECVRKEIENEEVSVWTHIVKGSMIGINWIGNTIFSWLSRKIGVE